MHLFLSLKVSIYLWGGCKHKLMSWEVQSYEFSNNLCISFNLHYVHLIYTKSCHWGSIIESADQALFPFLMKGFISSNMIDACFKVFQL